MPNQLDYPDIIPVPYIGVRPDRLAGVDAKLVETGTYQALFGTTVDDVIEVFFYDVNGSLAGVTNIAPTDPVLSLTTGIDNSGAFEFVNIDMGQVVREMTLDPGHYGVTVNYFRNEVGTVDGNQLVITDINSDRTELRLYPQNPNSVVDQEIFDFITPSVPKLFAQALLSETFGIGTEIQTQTPLSAGVVLTSLNAIDSDTSSRLDYAGVHALYNDITTMVLQEAYQRVLDIMAADASRYEVHEGNLEGYLAEAITEIIHELTSAGRIDPRLEVS